jgi:hypothetical protein
MEKKVIYESAPHAARPVTGMKRVMRGEVSIDAR